MPDFRSDTVTQPTATMRQTMLAAPLGDDVFGDDPSVNALQDHAAQLLGFEAALFAPTGTQTNLIALMGHCQRGDEAIVGQSWHTYRWEAGGMAVLGSIQPQPVETQPGGTLRLADIAAAIKPDDPHFARTRLVVLENTTGGQVLPTPYIAEVAALARARGLAMHLDGARLFNAATANAQANASDVYDEARAICAHFDTVSLCLSKGLGAPVGSLLLGSHGFIRQARPPDTMPSSTMCGAWRTTTPCCASSQTASRLRSARKRRCKGGCWCTQRRPTFCSPILRRTSLPRSLKPWRVAACA